MGLGRLGCGEVAVPSCPPTQIGFAVLSGVRRGQVPALLWQRSGATLWSSWLCRGVALSFLRSVLRSVLFLRLPVSLPVSLGLGPFRWHFGIPADPAGLRDAALCSSLALSPVHPACPHAACRGAAVSAPWVTLVLLFLFQA